jgi:hypothetical protein
LPALPIACRIALGLDANLDLDGGDAFGDHLGGLARRAVGIHEADAVRQRGALAYLAAEQLIDRHAVDLADGIVQGDVDRGLGVGIAAQHAVHAHMQLLDLGDVLPGDGGQQNVLERGRGHGRGLAVARAVIAAPGADDLRLAPADDAALEREPQHDIAFAEPCRMADPMVRAADGQGHQEDLAAADLQARHGHWRRNPARRAMTSAAPLFCLACARAMVPARARRLTLSTTRLRITSMPVRVSFPACSRGAFIFCSHALVPATHLRPGRCKVFPPVEGWGSADRRPDAAASGGPAA